MVDLGRQFSDLAGAVERYGRVPMEGRVEEAKMGWEKTKWDTQEARRAIEEGRSSERHTAFMGEAKEKERVRQDETLKREKMAKTPFNMGTSKLFDNVSIGSTELASRYMQILVKAVDPNAVFNPKSGQVEIYEKEGEVGEVPSKSRPASELEVHKALPIIIGAFGSVTDGLQVLKDAAARGNQKAINKLETLNTPEALKAYYEEMLATKQEIYNAVITSGKATPELANMMKSGLGHTIEKIKEYSNVINAETVRQRGIIDESIKQGRLQQQKIIFNDIALLDKQIAASQKILSQGYENQFGVLTPVDPNEKDTSGNPTVNAIMARANQKIIDTANIKKCIRIYQVWGMLKDGGVTM